MGQGGEGEGGGGKCWSEGRGGLRPFSSQIGGALAVPRRIRARGGGDRQGGGEACSCLFNLVCSSSSFSSIDALTTSPARGQLAGVTWSTQRVPHLHLMVPVAARVRGAVTAETSDWW